MVHLRTAATRIPLNIMTLTFLASKGDALVAGDGGRGTRNRYVAFQTLNLPAISCKKGVVFRRPLSARLCGARVECHASVSPRLLEAPLVFIFHVL